MSWPKVELFSQELVNPLIASSGTIGFEEVCDGSIDFSKIGAVILKSIKPDPVFGNPPPRVSEITKEDVIECYYLEDLEDEIGFINRIGLQGPGIDAFIIDYAPKMRRAIKVRYDAEYPLRIIASIAGGSIDEYMILTRYLEDACSDFLFALEVNISCPNTADGLVFGTNADLTFELIRTLRNKWLKPLIVKLTPNTEDICAVAEAVLRVGADAISLINTVKCKARMKDGHIIEGGLSGPIIRKIARKLVKEVCERFPTVPVIAGGGVFYKEDVLAMLELGATAVGVGTLNLTGKNAIIELASTLA